MKRVQQGLHLHFDPLSGIAGDMTVAALVDVGVPRAVISDAVAAMKVPGLDVSFEKRRRGAYVGTGFVVHMPSDAGPKAGKVGKAGKAKAARGKASAKTARAPAGHDHDHDHAGHDHDHDHAGHDHDHDAEPSLLLLPQSKRPRIRAGKPPGTPHDPGHHHRDYAEIRRLLKRAALDPDVRALAEEIFARIAEAESSLHGIALDRIGFHEVGAYDSIADIVGAAAAIVWLAPSAVTSSAPVVGTGHVRTAHGPVPVPAPATALLLAGIPFTAEGKGELTTPTGAAILAAVVDRFGAPPPMRLAGQGFGAGTREMEDRANVLRVMVGEPLGESLAESPAEVTLIESNIDDMNPQLVGPLLDALLAAGAVDAWATPILMKKGRPALTLSALCPPAAQAAVTLAFFENSSTIGVRTRSLGRTVLERSAASLKTAYGKVAVKLSAWQGRVLSATPEFEDCRRLAAAARVPVRVVLAAASAGAQSFVTTAVGSKRG